LSLLKQKSIPSPTQNSPPALTASAPASAPAPIPNPVLPSRYLSNLLGFVLLIVPGAKFAAPKLLISILPRVK